MTTLVFLLAIASVVGVVVALEPAGRAESAGRVRLGLIGWLTGGNWPAKIGGGLVVVGVGALIRFALQNLDVSPSIKLGTGVASCAILAFASAWAGSSPQRRTVSLALGGAAFGVAYLTAYSAFALFGYLSGETGVALLILTAAGASVYAVTRSALSLAVLAMFGAFLAPAFAVSDPGPGTLYSYYAAASLVTLAMVAARGWRPLIHLSFLFTLAGGVFFAWTSQYYSPEYAAVMRPALLVLTAIHVAMPILERRGADRPWLQNLDFAYTLALPAVAALSAAVLSDSRTGLSITLAGLGAIWLAAALWLWIVRREGIAHHLVIGAMLLGLAGAARFRDLPWALLALAFSVAAFAAASRWSSSRRLHNILAGLIPLAGSMHVIVALAPAPGVAPFINERFAERLIGAVLLMTGGYLCRRARNAFDTLLWSVGIAWAIVAIGLELLRADLVTIALVLHWATLAAVVAAIFASRRRALDGNLIFLPLAVVLTASWASDRAGEALAWASFIAAPLVLTWFGLAQRERQATSRGAVVAAIVLAPLVAGIWAEPLAGFNSGDRSNVAACAAAAVALLLLWLPPLTRRAAWEAPVEDIFAFALATLLAFSTLVEIERVPSALVLEVLCVAGLISSAMRRPGDAPASAWIAPVAAIGAGLWIQALVLRALGPPGDLTLLSIADMRAPAALSLVWASAGAAMTVWGRRTSSRSRWVAGAALLVAATIKIVLLDVGSLGQLGNILAVIAAGLVFLAVGWLAPMPPAAAPPARPAVPPRAAPSARPAAAVPAAPAPSSEHADAGASSAASRPSPSAERAPGAAPAGGDYWSYAERGATVPPRPRVDAAGAPAAHSDSVGRVVTVVLIAFLLLGVFKFGLRFVAWLLLAMPMVDAHRPPPSPPPLAKYSPPATVQAAPAPSALAAAPQPASVDGRAPPAPAASPPAVATVCDRWVEALPAVYDLLAGGAYKGKPLSFAIDSTNHVAGSFDVFVNMPDHDVVLMLGAYEPSVWTIGWSPGTRIAGVWVSGYYEQRVTGVDAATPVLETHSGGSSGCPRFHVSTDQAAAVGNAAQKVLMRAPSRVLIADDAGRLRFGDTAARAQVEHADVLPAESFRDTSVPSAGDAGLDELIRARRLRRATNRDVENWQRYAQAAGIRSGSLSIPSGSSEPVRTFVVLGPMTFPSGLYGAHLAFFIVPKGVERPTGDPGHSQIFDMN
ncbi:MAG TPA: DUF2339 domain-containing protein [Gammaproteobacteria bacterium]|nr:DUF2339 domain-containing protein [Gammaproteobacteria bacterium]